jgi:hypothetical protein
VLVTRTSERKEIKGGCSLTAPGKGNIWSIRTTQKMIQAGSRSLGQHHEYEDSRKCEAELRTVGRLQSS